MPDFPYDFYDAWETTVYYPGSDRFDSCPAAGADGLCGICESLYLARVIAEHGKEQS